MTDDLRTHLVRDDDKTVWLFPTKAAEFRTKWQAACKVQGVPHYADYWSSARLILDGTAPIRQLVCAALEICVILKDKAQMPRGFLKTEQDIARFANELRLLAEAVGTRV